MGNHQILSLSDEASESRTTDLLRSLPCTQIPAERFLLVFLLILFFLHHSLCLLNFAVLLSSDTYLIELLAITAILTQAAIR